MDQADLTGGNLGRQFRMDPRHLHPALVGIGRDHGVGAAAQGEEGRAADAEFEVTAAAGGKDPMHQIELVPEEMRGAELRLGRLGARRTPTSQQGRDGQGQGLGFLLSGRRSFPSGTDDGRPLRRAGSPGSGGRPSGAMPTLSRPGRRLAAVKASHGERQGEASTHARDCNLKVYSDG
jgi:hypothetical protein